MSRRALLRALAVVALVAATGVFVGVPAAPAAAADKPIGLSYDSVTYTDQLASSVFAGVLIVPGRSVTRTFWVKNRTALPGNLAIALQGITGTDSNLIAALSLRATAGSASGANTPFTSADPCVSLLSGVSLPAGSSVQVDVRLSMGPSVGGQTSQASVGSFKIPVTLTSTDVAAPSGCTSTPPVNPPTGGPTGGDPTGGTPPGTIDTADISGSSDGTVTGEVDNGALSGLRGNGTIHGSVVVPNTGRFFQEIDVVAWLVALILGGIVAWRVRRRQYEEEAYA